MDSMRIRNLCEKLKVIGVLSIENDIEIINKLKLLINDWSLIAFHRITEHNTSPNVLDEINWYNTDKIIPSCIMHHQYIQAESTILIATITIDDDRVLFESITRCTITITIPESFLLEIESHINIDLRQHFECEYAQHLLAQKNEWIDNKLKEFQGE